MEIKEEGVGTAPEQKLVLSQHTEIKRATTVTRHNTRPLRDRRLPKLLGDRLFTIAITTHVNVVGAKQNTSDEKLERTQRLQHSSSALPRTVSRSW